MLLALVMLFTKVKKALSKEIVGEPRVTVLALVLMFVVGLWLGLIVLELAHLGWHYTASWRMA